MVLSPVLARDRMWYLSTDTSLESWEGRMSASLWIQGWIVLQIFQVLSESILRIGNPICAENSETGTKTDLFDRTNERNPDNSIMIQEHDSLYLVITTA